MGSAKKKNLESLRGLACLLLVFNHLIGHPNITGLKLEDGNPYYLFNVALEHTRMPLFAFLGGVVFSFRGLRIGGRFDLLQGKIVRLIFPLLFVGPLFLYLQANTGGANVNVTTTSLDYYLSVVWRSQAHFWFLQAMFLVFVFYILLSFFVDKALIQYFVGLIFGVVLLLYFPADIYIFSLSGFFFLLPFFSFGALIGSLNFAELNHQKFLKIFLAVVVLAFVVAKIRTLGDGEGGYGKESLFGVLFGFSSCLLLYCIGASNKYLIYVGGYSFTIFLYHVFFLAAARLLLNKLGLTELFLNLFFGMIFGVLGPIVVHIIFSRFRFTSIAMLGQKNAVA